jgi:hypothetical protein
MRRQRIASAVFSKAGCPCASFISLAVKDMNEIRLKAKSSSGEPYELVFTHHGEFFTVFCPCQAGVYGKLCKHKTQLLQGDETMLDDPSEAPTLARIRAWLDASEYASLLEQHSAIKKEIDAARRKEQTFKNTIEEAMRKGIPFGEKT